MWVFNPPNINITEGETDDSHASGRDIANMAVHHDLLLGEWVRSVDQRYRVSLPSDLTGPLTDKTGHCVVAKERRGCLSLWNSQQWGQWLEEGVSLVTRKIQSGRLAGRLDRVQLLGRLLSTRHRTVPIAGRGRIIIPESFREFLGVGPEERLLVVGAAICIELWHPQRWNEHVEENMPEFRQLFDQLAD